MQFSLAGLAATAVAKDPPLVDFDNTVFIQLGLFLITAFLLTRFLFRPYLRLRADREEGIQGARDLALRMDEQAKAQMGDYDVRLTRAKLKAAEERTKLRIESVNREREITDEARKLNMGAVLEARAKLNADATAARAALEPRTQEIARVIAKKILGREIV